MNVDTAAATIAEQADLIFASLTRLGSHLQAAWTRHQQAGDPFDSTHVSALSDEIAAALDHHPEFESAGFVFAADVLADAPLHLEWWHRGDGGPHDRLSFNLEPGAPDQYDYYAMDWFQAAVDGHQRFASGPLIDLPCAAVYILTFSQPVLVGNRLLGVAGADVAVSRFEPRILPTLRALPAPSVLVNSERRVIASNDAWFTTGEKLPTMPGTDNTWATVRPVATDLGWHIASDHQT